MDWTAGYASDIEYTAGYYPEQAPGHLNLVCALNGCEPPSLAGPFTYFELGFGRGLTANVLAAGNPRGTFYAADFNPAHVAGARELAAEAGLDNLTLLENSFEELAAGAVAGLPGFDYITLHGIYTWVTAENRRHIVAFINRYLKPGGVVYVGYNAMPGWAGALPLQRLLVEHGDAFPERGNARIDNAARFVAGLSQAGCGYIDAHPSLAPRLEALRSGSRNYLLHEYMHKHWQPLYHADVARDLALAKMEFAGSAALPMAYPPLYLSPAHATLIDAFPDPVMRETLKDYLLNSSFRKDVFVRGLRKTGPARQAELLSRVRVALTVPRAAVDLAFKTPLGTLDGEPALYHPVCDALARRPHTVAELAALPALAGNGIASLMEVAALLSASGQAGVGLHGGGAGDPAPARRLNAALVGRLRDTDEFKVLCAPSTGGAVGADVIERFVYGVLARRGAVPQEIGLDALAREVWAAMDAVGRRLARDGAVLSGEADNVAELLPRVEAIVRAKLPIWRQLDML